MTKLIPYLLVAAAGIVGGLLLARTDTGQQLKSDAAELRSRTVQGLAYSAGLDARKLVLLENPRLIERIMEGGAFGGETSVVAAQNMFSRLPEAIDDLRAKTEVQEVAPRSFLVRMPIVNAVFFVTDAGVVLVDTGMGPAGPALLEAIRSVTDAPVHTVIYTHGHVDHAYGTWALLEAGENPEIIAHTNLKARFERYIRLRGSLANYMNQPPEQLPDSADDLVWPSRYFEGRLELEIGGETFVLQHHRGETDDQLYVWVPSRGALASADYYQGFLPNAGNGKRSQRYVEEWAVALREMASLQPAILLPAHGAAITNSALIVDNLTVLAEALEHIAAHTIDGLNAGLRKDLIYRSAALPPALAAHPTLNEQYVSPADISKMVIKQYTGWWDDIPSNWTPAPLEAQGELLIALAGGNIAAVTAYGHTLAEQDIRLASHLADWLFMARPEDADVQQLVQAVYYRRIMDPASNTMEILTYLDQMAAARTRAAAR